MESVVVKDANSLSFGRLINLEYFSEFFLCSLFFFYCDLVFVNVDQSFFLLIVFLFVLFLWDCLLVHPLNIFVDSPFEYVC